MPNKSLQRTVLHAAGEFHSYYVMTKYQGQERQIVFVCIGDGSLQAVEKVRCTLTQKSVITLQKARKCGKIRQIFKNIASPKRWPC